MQKCQRDDEINYSLYLAKLELTVTDVYSLLKRESCQVRLDETRTLEYLSLLPSI